MTLRSYDKADDGEENNMISDVFPANNPPEIYQNRVDMKRSYKVSTQIPRNDGRCCIIFGYAKKTEYGSDENEYDGR